MRRKTKYHQTSLLGETSTQSIKQPGPFALLNPRADLLKTGCAAAVGRGSKFLLLHRGCVLCKNWTALGFLLFIQHSKAWVYLHLYLLSYLLNFRLPCFI